jgi:hypothetical protein
MPYGTINVDTLTASTGVLATQNGMTGIAKAWVNYNAVTQAVTTSFNVSSVTYVGTGQFTVNFTTAMPNANYCSLGSSSYGASGDALIDFADTGATVSSMPVVARNFSASRQNPYQVFVAVFSS